MPNLPTQHAALASRNFECVPYKNNTTGLWGPSMQYGNGCLDGLVFSIKAVDGKLFYVVVDAGAHIARHIRNTILSVENAYRLDVPTVDQCFAAGRAYDPSTLFRIIHNLDFQRGITHDIGPLQVLVGKRGLPLNFESYERAIIDLVLVNLNFGFFGANYLRPFSAKADFRHDGSDANFAIAGSFNPLEFSLMPIKWHDITSLRDPNFMGSNLLLTTRSSASGGSCLQDCKHTSAYWPSRGGSVDEREHFNRMALAADKSNLVAGDVLISGSDYDLREGSGSNIFVVNSSGEISTPNLDGTVFPGVTQDCVYTFITKYGSELGLSIRREPISSDLAFLRSLSDAGGELFLTGSAAGIICAKNIIVPKDPKQLDSPRSLSDYHDPLPLSHGPNSVGQLLRDILKCISLGNAFEIERSGKAPLRVDDFVGWPLLIEVPASLRPMVQDAHLASYASDRPPLREFVDYSLSSGRVNPINSLKGNRVHTR